VQKWTETLTQNTHNCKPSLVRVEAVKSNMTIKTHIFISGSILIA